VTKPGGCPHQAKMPLRPSPRIPEVRPEHLCASEERLSGETETTRDDSTPALSTKQLATVYDDYADFVWRSLRRLGVTPNDLEDAAQDVFVVVHRRLDEFQARSSLKSWIFAIALHIAKAYRRRRAQDLARTDDSEVELVGSLLTPEEAHAKQQAAELVLAILERLDDDKRAVFVLVELEHMPVAEIAVALSIPPNTVYSRLRLAREDFQNALRRLRAKNQWRYR
jgi:RNA polymerase sigma-70 factor, ECF subfamily